MAATKAKKLVPVEVKPQVEIHIAQSRSGAAASGESDSRLTDDQIALLQETLTTLVGGFSPPEAPPQPSGFALDSLEVEIGFKLETGPGKLLKLLLDAKGEASIKAKVVWKKH